MPELQYEIQAAASRTKTDLLQRCVSAEGLQGARG
jgi:hypothetical protein